MRFKLSHQHVIVTNFNCKTFETCEEKNGLRISDGTRI